LKACVLHDIGDLRYEDVPTPVAETEEMLLQVRASGICGSDIPRVFVKGTYHFPTIPGHEFSGVVVGGGDENLLGKRAAVFPLIPCRTCPMCKAGEYAQCSDYDYYGSRRDGAFAEYIAVKKWNLVFIPDNVSYEEAAMCEPASVALHAIRRAGVEPGQTVVIFGAGPIGIILAQWAKAAGAKDILLYDIDAEKCAFAEQMGFGIWHEGLTADVVIEGTGAASALVSCISCAKPFAKLVLMGNPFGDMPLSQKVYWEILRKQLTLTGTWNSSYNDRQNDWADTLREISAGHLNLQPLITHRFDLAECGSAFDIMRSRTEFFSKIMFVNK
jgi:L-iditol 2-dehydrogenase